MARLILITGDGGGSGDPDQLGQSLGTLLGKILRIDVDSGDPYAVPPSNPFVGQEGARDEIWALGFRNPWRFSFDRMTGDMYIADREAAISSVIYGPDRRTRIRQETKRALFTVYAPPGIGEEAVWEHLREIEANVGLIAPGTKTEVMEVYLAG